MKKHNKNPKTNSINKLNETKKNSNNNSINHSKRNNNSYIINQSKANGENKASSQKKIDNLKSMKINNSQNIKKSAKTSMSNLNSKLSSVNYNTKPIYYMLYNQMKPNHFGYKYDRDFLFIPYPFSRNNDDNTYSNKNEEKKDNSLRDKSSNNNYISIYSDSSFINDLNNIKKIILIQSCFRGFLARKKIYNTLSLYSKYKKDINSIEKINQCKINLFSNLKQFNKEFQIYSYRLKKYKRNIKNCSINKNINFTIFDHKYKININNKNNDIKKIEFFTINNCYENKYDKIKEYKNYEIISNESYNKEKEMYEKKIKELIEENNKIKEKNTQNSQYESKYNDIVQKNNELNNNLKNIMEENNKIKNKNNEYENKYQNIQKENEKLNNISKEINNKLKQLKEDNNKLNEENKQYQQKKNEDINNKRE